MNTPNITCLARLLKDLVLGGSLGLCLVLACALSLLSENVTAQAAHLPGDPLVIIDADVTNLYGPCTEVFQANIGTKEETTTRIFCPPGTLLKSEIVHQSQAVAKHEPFVIAPSPNASAAEKRRTWLQFQQLDEAKTRAHQQSLSKAALHPLVQCGQPGAFYTFWWTSDNTELESYISYYKSTDCSTVAFDTSWIQYLYQGDNNPEYWDWEMDKYAGHIYRPGAGCPYYLTPYLNYRASYFVGTTAAPGYYYENWITWAGCGAEVQHNDTGPIN